MGLLLQAGGTWFVDLRGNVPLVRDASGGELYIGEDANSAVAASKQSISIRNGGGGTPLRLQLNYWNGSSVVNIFQTTTDTCKIAIKFTATSFDVFQNGVKVVTANAFTGNVPLTYVGTRTSPSVSETPFINIKSMALFNTQLSDAECLALTTL